MESLRINEDFVGLPVQIEIRLGDLVNFPSAARASVCRPPTSPSKGIETQRCRR